MAYTDIDDPSAYFQTALFTGNAGTNAITNTGNSDLQPDWVWLKCRSAAEHHGLFDSVRGVTKVVYSNLNNAEDNLADTLASFNSDGFTMGADTGSGGSFNGSGKTMAAWQWKAGTSFTNDASSTGIGSIDSAGSVNNDAGFSICTHTGTGSNATIKHGLSTAPKMILTKKRSASGGWQVGHEGIGWGNGMYLYTTDASTGDAGAWNSTAPTSSIFTVGNSSFTNQSSATYVSYIFAEKKGYSKFSSYTGNGSATNGTFVYTGFKPAFVMLKKHDAASYWSIMDNKRPGSFNTIDDTLKPNVSDAESDIGDFDFLANGFKIYANTGNVNGSGSNYIYMAFAENPFVTSTGVPATAR